MVSNDITVVSSKVELVFRNPDTQLVCPAAADETSFGPENLCAPREETLESVAQELTLARLK
jgi:energy-coupling factor transporter ATP-binding protein EcfA2